MKRIVLTLAAAAAGLFAAVMPASASVHAGHAAITAVTTLTNRPDSGAQGNDWALDNMTRTVSVKLVGEVAASNCPGTLTGHCYLWNASISDSGTFTTAAGQLAPRAGTLDSAITGAVKGGAPHVQFFSSWKTAKASLVPVSLDGTGSAPHEHDQLGGAVLRQQRRVQLGSQSRRPRLGELELDIHGGIRLRFSVPERGVPVGGRPDQRRRIARG